MGLPAVSRHTARRVLIGMAMVALLGCPDGSAKVEARVFRVPSHGRLALATADLAGVERVALHLALADGGIGPTRIARVVAPDGRRLDTRVERVPAETPTFRLELAADFLRPGGYLIEIDGQGAHALNLRRYVVVVAGEDGRSSEP